MPLIEKSKSTFEKLKGVSIDTKTLSEVKAYCTHFDVTLEEFANQAFKFILLKDKDWKKENKISKEKSSE